MSDDNLSEEEAMEIFGVCFGDEFKEMMEGLMDYEDELDYEMNYDEWKLIMKGQENKSHLTQFNHLDETW